MKRIVSGVFGLFLIWFGINNLLIHFNIISDKEKSQCVELIETGGTAIATYDIENSKELTKKIKGVTTSVSYRLKYSFEANGQKYFGEQETSEYPANLMTRVTYIKSDPSINMINPQARLADLNELRGSTRDVLIGIGAILIGLFFVLRRYLEFKRYSNKKTLEKAGASGGNTMNVNAERSKFESSETNSKLPPPPRFAKKYEDKLKEEEAPKSSTLKKRNRVEKDVEPTIRRDELLAKSQKTFKETDHSRFFPPSMRTQTEEE